MLWEKIKKDKLGLRWLGKLTFEQRHNGEESKSCEDLGMYLT